MAKKPVKYSVVDAFTESAFKGNPAAVCLLEEDKDDQWLQAVASEFNLSETCYLTRVTDSTPTSAPRFGLRWFTPSNEVVLPSAKAVVDLQPKLDAIQKCPGSGGVIVTGIALPESEYDFYSRYFCPKHGIDEDPVCGSAHCALASYWCKKLGKSDVFAYAFTFRHPLEAEQ